MKTLCVFGTRPEAIKMAPVVRALESDDRFANQVCVTAQHRELLDEVLELFEVRPDFDLDIMKRAQSLDYITAEVLQGVSRVLDESRPDIVLVHGDTTTTFATSLAAFYKNIPVGHVEAGLRTGDLRQPFPEEFNRLATSIITELFFAPTNSARQNLLNERVPESRIEVTGNTVIDALHHTVARAEKCTVDELGLPEEVSSILTENRRIILLTGHRRENQGGGLARVASAVAEATRRFDDVHVILPLHPSPRVREELKAVLQSDARVTLCGALSYLPFCHLLSKSHIVVTDSGGIQEEGPALGKPILVTREVSERPEAIEAGVAKLVGTDHATIVEQLSRLLSDSAAYAQMAQRTSPYGDGKAAERIVSRLLRFSAKAGGA